MHTLQILLLSLGEISRSILSQKELIHVFFGDMLLQILFEVSPECISDVFYMICRSSLTAISQTGQSAPVALSAPEDQRQNRSVGATMGIPF